jgi:hypothetical protein
MVEGNAEAKEEIIVQAELGHQQDVSGEGRKSHVMGIEDDASDVKEAQDEKGDTIRIVPTIPISVDGNEEGTEN